MKYKKAANGNCPVLYALSIIGGKWRIPILWYLSQSDLRYNDLKRKMGSVTNIMLTRSLKELEEHGLVKRTQFIEIPPHVVYSLTEQGTKLIPALVALKDWGVEQIESTIIRDKQFK